MQYIIQSSSVQSKKKKPTDVYMKIFKKKEEIFIVHIKELLYVFNYLI